VAAPNEFFTRYVASTFAWSNGWSFSAREQGGDSRTFLLMNSTSISLLQRLKRPDEPAAWRRFVSLYAPLIFYWGRGQGLSEADAADLVQEVLAILIVKLPDFQYDPSRRFRGWLRTVTLNKAKDIQRRNHRAPETGQSATLQHVAAPSDVNLFEEQEYQSFLVTRALELLQSEFRDSTWRAGWLQLVEGRIAADVAAELGITLNAAYVAKCRIVRRLREELAGLLD